MTPKQYLSQINIYNESIKSLIDDVEQIKAKLTNVSVSPSPDKVTGGITLDFTDTIARLTDFQKELDDEIDRYVNLRKKIIKEIYGIGNKLYSSILYERYINELDLMSIARKLNYSYAHVRRSHGWALMAFDKKFLKHDTQ